MVPSTYEDGTLYNVLPSGNKAPDETGNANGYDQTRADFSFTRGANLAATRVNASGLIEKGRENLLLQSNQFDTTWANISSSETSGQEGYDGTNNAWLLTKSGTNGRIQQSITGTGVYTFSIYAKAGTNNWCTLIADFVSGTDVIVWFDLQNGIVGTESGSPIESKISSIDNGWYRISISFTCPASLQTLRIYVADGDNDNSGTTGSIYIQDAQLEAGLVSTPYIETGATTATAGVLENTPRIDYSSGAGALLLEPQRTNLIPNSEYFGSGSGWSLLNNVSVGNFVLSPEGKMNATQIIFDGSIGGRIERTISGLTAGANYSVSVYARVASGTQDVFFGSFEDTPAITLTTEWQRFEKTQPENDTNAYPRIRCEEAATIEIFGFQLEAGSHVSSYVPTYGAAATRGADSCSVTGVSDVIGQTEGTLFVEYTASHEGSAGERIFAIGDGTSSNRIVLFEATNKIRVYAADGGAVQWDYVTTIDFEGTHKIAVTYAANNAAIYIDGTQLSTDTSFVVPNCGNVYLGTSEAFGVSIGGSIKEAILFDSALTQSEAEALTTL